jgi:hypothetical protein
MELGAFIETWLGAKGGRERSNFPTFIFGLCDALGLPKPVAVAEKQVLGDYEFEGPVPGGSFRSLKATGIAL